jgi:hypothetical protein
MKEKVAKKNKLSTKSLFFEVLPPGRHKQDKRK